MSDTIPNSVKTRRAARGWSQAELAERAGISRASVSAIEGDRLAPSVTAALALARALECTVEALFGVPDVGHGEREWALPPPVLPCLYWKAEISGRTILYPVERSPLGFVPHDGVAQGSNSPAESNELARRTLVVACCDPAVGLLAEEYNHRTGFRLLVIPRGSRAAAELLARGLVHAAGLHLSRPDEEEGNANAVRAARLPGAASLLRVARWQEGVAHAYGQKLASTRAARTTKLHWVGREEGSGARRCLDELLSGRPQPRRQARNHLGVIEAISNGWADAGVCVRLACEEAQLAFLPVWEEDYELCYTRSLEQDPRVQGLVEVVRSKSYRSRLSELPGYQTAQTGELQYVAGNQ